MIKLALLNPDLSQKVIWWHVLELPLTIIWLLNSIFVVTGHQITIKEAFKNGNILDKFIQIVDV